MVQQLSIAFKCKGIQYIQEELPNLPSYPIVVDKINALI